MQSVSVGGLPVSRLCLGTMYFGSTVARETSYALLDGYAEAGGNFLDTANNYAYWVDGGSGDESETLVGRSSPSRWRAACADSAPTASTCSTPTSTIRTLRWRRRCVR